MAAALSLTAPSTGVADEQDPVPASVQNRLADWEVEAGWVLLFDGSSLDGWRGYMESGDSPQGWHVRGGTLAFDGEGTDLITVGEYSDFELTFEWRAGPGGNSGVLFRAIEGPERIHDGAPMMQLADPGGAPEAARPLTAPGAAYGVQAATEATLRSSEEWNRGRILVQGAHVEHWLNGQMVLSYELWTREWKERVRQSPFSDRPEYGMARTGHIGLEGGSAPVAYRNIKLRPIPPGAR